MLHGPNLNLLGTREPGVYGTVTLGEIDQKLAERGRARGVSVRSHQTNSEGALVELIHAAAGQAHGILINAGAYTHTSIALFDAIKAIRTPVIEVHLSDPTKREAFRHHSYIGMAAADTVQGLGARSYLVALERAASL